MELSVVIPAYDEERRLPHTLRSVLAYLRANEPSWEVVVVDDGSADATAAVVRSAGRDEPRLRLVRWPVNRGKGHAVRIGVLASIGRTVLLCDADLATPIEELPLLQAALDQGASAAVGSRAVDGARLETRQDRLREVFGRLGNGLIRSVAVPGISDTQCGFKLYAGSPARLVHQLARLDGWCSDAEVLHLFGRLGLPIAEVGVRWSHQPGSKVTAASYLHSFTELIRIRNYHHNLPPLRPELDRPRLALIHG